MSQRLKMSATGTDNLFHLQNPNGKRENQLRIVGFFIFLGLHIYVYWHASDHTYTQK